MTTLKHQPADGGLAAKSLNRAEVHVRAAELMPIDGQQLPVLVLGRKWVATFVFRRSFNALPTNVSRRDYDEILIRSKFSS